MSLTKDHIIYGRNPVLEALDSGKDIDKILISNSIRGEFEKEIRAKSRNRRVPLQYVPNSKLDKMVKGNHQGILAFAAIIQYQDIEQIIPGIFERGELPLLLVLDGVTDVRNFGAIVRSAEVLGAHAIIIGEKKSARINNDAVKSSSGALLKMPICRVPSIYTTLELIREYGIKIYSSSLESNRKIFEIDFKQPLAIIMGSEGEGISSKSEQISDESFIIPQIGEIDSLNVSVATGVILYEILKQRNEY